MNRFLLFLFIGLSCSGCIKFTFHPYDGRIKGEVNINEKNIQKIETLTKNKTAFKFAFIGDTQGWYDETEKFVKAINERDDIDFIIHGGDISDFGITEEFVRMRDILNKLHKPYVVIIGNHDFLATGEEVFAKIFGDINFTFTAGNVQFVCLNTNALEADYSRPVPDFSFIDKTLLNFPSAATKTIVAMHAKPYSEQFNNNIATLFHYKINSFPNLLFGLNAHNHRFSEDDIFNDGILYYGTPNIDKRQYLTFTITANNHSYELHSF